MIPRASYQTVSRLQQLLSAQNTQALPFQLKGSLTKSEGEKKYPAGGELGSLQHKGLFGGSSIARAPRKPQPQVPPQQRLWRRPRGQAIPDPALGLWLVLGCSCWVQLSLPAQVMGLRAQRAGPGERAARGGRGVPVEGQFPSRQHSAVSARGAAPQANSRRSDGHLGLTPESRGCTHLLQAGGMRILELGTPMYAAPAAPQLP